MNIICTNCSNPLPNNAKFCNKCGNQTAVIIENKGNEGKINCICGLETPTDVKFCHNCGLAIDKIKQHHAEKQAQKNMCACGKKIEEDMKFCPECGSKVVYKPESSVANNNIQQHSSNLCVCGTVLNPNQKFCAECGKTVDVANENQNYVNPPPPPQQNFNQPPAYQSEQSFNNTQNQNTPPQQAPQFNNPQYPNNYQQVPKKKKGKGAKVFFLIVFLFALAGFAAIFFLKENPLEWLGLNRSEPDIFATNIVKIKDPSVFYVPTYDSSSPFGTHTENLSVDNPKFSHEGVSLSIMPDFVDEDMNLTVRPLKLTDNWEGVTANAYEFKLDKKNQDIGVIEIRISYTKTNENDFVGAGYYNARTRKWEPVYFIDDYKNSEIVILTDHLSSYSSLIMSNDGKRNAQISVFFSRSLSSKYERAYNNVIVEAANNGMTPGNEATELGLSVLSDWLNYSGQVLNLENLAYGSSFLESFSGVLTNIGYGLSLSQVAYDYSNGNTRKAGAKALQTAQSYAISKFSTTSLQIAMIGVFFIDYSLNKFIKTAISGREKIYIDAYNLYYSSKSPAANKVRSNVDWFHIFIDIIDNADSPKQANERIMKNIDDYVNEFWNNESGMTWAFAEVKSGFTYRGGSNKNLEKRISDNHKAELLNGGLQSVFHRIEREYKMRQYDQYLDDLDALKVHLNKRVEFVITEEKTGEDFHFAGAYIRFAPLSDNADIDNWTGRINKNGRARTYFTVIGHLTAGAPSKVLLFMDEESLEKNKPDMEIDFLIDMPLTTVVFKADEIQFEDILGTYDFSQTLDDFDMGVVGDLLDYGLSAADVDVSGDIYTQMFPEAGTVSKGKMEITKKDEDIADVIMTFVDDGYNHQTKYVGKWKNGALTIEPTQEVLGGAYDLTFVGTKNSITFKGVSEYKTTAISYSFTIEGRKTD
jgi:endogenous inhibitor of DNA gyrase (YacG/DUF329 family)